MNAKYAYNILTNEFGVGVDADTKKALLDLVKKDPEYAYNYANDQIKGRWLEAEEYIKNNPHYAVKYAEDVIKGRWREAEDVIKTNARCAYYYAKDVIKGRWIEAEDIIEQNGYAARDYAKDVANDNSWCYNTGCWGFWAKRRMLKVVENFKNSLETVPENPELENLKKQRDELDLKIKKLETV